MNPDSDFVLHGRSSSYWSRPGYLSNSQLTTTTKDLDNYNPECYDDIGSRRMTQSLRSMSKNLNRVSSHLKHSLLSKESMSSYDRHSSLRTTATEDELKHLSQDVDSKHTSDGNPCRHTASQWYTQPVHMSHVYTPGESTQLRPRSVSPVYRTSGSLGPAIDDELSSKSRVFREIEYKKYKNEDGMAAEYFPVTLGAAYYMQTAPCKPDTLVRSANGRMSKPMGGMNKVKRAKVASRVEEILRDVPHPHYQGEMSFLATEAPTIASSINVITVTPYEAELGRLRMERLRIEEDRLLEVKRQEELERIRGPKPKWYELKSPEFHYEAHKNNQLIRSREKWDDLLAYREDLTAASNNFQKSWETPMMA